MEDVSPQLDFLAPAGDVSAELAVPLDRLWPLRERLLLDLDTLLGVTPRLAEIVFGRFQFAAWPRAFIAAAASRAWPSSPEWGRRLVTDAKLRALAKRLVLLRREGRKAIVFSQFTDTIDYISSVLRACASLPPADKEALLSDLDVPSPRAAELDDLLRTTGMVTGGTEDRESIIDSFSPFYRIGPFPPDSLLEQAATWDDAWAQALEKPIEVVACSSPVCRLSPSRSRSDSRIEREREHEREDRDDRRGRRRRRRTSDPPAPAEKIRRARAAAATPPWRRQVRQAEKPGKTRPQTLGTPGA